MATNYEIQQILARRMDLLLDSDWTHSVSDRPVQYKTEWATYRQALRDITKQAGYPDEVVWPVSPHNTPRNIGVENV